MNIFAVIIQGFIVPFLYSTGQHFIASSPNELSFFFEEPILSHRLQVNVLSATGSIYGSFYWRMNLIGCPLRNGKHIIELLCMIIIIIQQVLYYLKLLQCHQHLPHQQPLLCHLTQFSPVHLW